MARNDDVRFSVVIETPLPKTKFRSCYGKRGQKIYPSGRCEIFRWTFCHRVSDVTYVRYLVFKKNGGKNGSRRFFENVSSFHAFQSRPLMRMTKNFTKLFFCNKSQNDEQFASS